EQHADALRVGAADERPQVVRVAVVGPHCELVADGVAEVARRAGGDRREPDRVHAEPGEVREPLRHRPKRRRAEPRGDHAVHAGGRVLLGHRRGYLRPLIAMPRTKYLWKSKNATSTGSVAITEPAITRSQDVR